MLYDFCNTTILTTIIVFFFAAVDEPVCPGSFEFPSRFPVNTPAGAAEVGALPHAEVPVVCALRVLDGVVAVPLVVQRYFVVSAWGKEVV